MDSYSQIIPTIYKFKNIHTVFLLGLLENSNHFVTVMTIFFFSWSVSLKRQEQDFHIPPRESSLISLTSIFRRLLLQFEKEDKLVGDSERNRVKLPDSKDIITIFLYS